MPPDSKCNYELLSDPPRPYKPIFTDIHYQYAGQYDDENSWSNPNDEGLDDEIEEINDMDDEEMGQD